MLLKKIYIEKEVIRHITEDIENFSNNFDEIQIKSKYHNCFFEGASLKIYFLLLTELAADWINCFLNGC